MDAFHSQPFARAHCSASSAPTDAKCLDVRKFQARTQLGAPSLRLRAQASRPALHPTPTTPVTMRFPAYGFPAARTACRGCAKSASRNVVHASAQDVILVETVEDQGEARTVFENGEQGATERIHLAPPTSDARLLHMCLKARTARRHMHTDVHESCTSIVQLYSRRATNAIAFAGGGAVRRAGGIQSLS